MQVVEFSRVAYPLMLVVLLGAALLLPTLRVYRLTHKWPLGVLRNTSRVERLISLLLLLLALGFALWAVAYAMLGPTPLRVWPLHPLLHWFGWFIVAAGAAVIVAAQFQMGRAWRLGIDADSTPLITTGLFRVIRNPIYAGLMLVFAGLLLVSPSPFLLGLIVPTVSLIIFQAHREERHLHERHGTAFEVWAASTGRFLPWLGRLR